MKKFILIGLIFAVLLSFVACNSTDIDKPYTDHTHTFTNEPETIPQTIEGYCGNTQTTIYVGDKSYTFMYGNSVALTDMLLHLDYKNDICKCLPQYIVDTEFGKGYGINLKEGYVRHNDQQANLTKEQINTIKKIITKEVLL